MKPYQTQFIQLALKYEALKFGQFTLKSGRVSPYFFNAGLFQTGSALAQLGRHYSSALMASGLEFDMVFGPAYKGIPLAATTAVALADHFDRDIGYCFNRKEVKAHGEGGQLVGAPLSGDVVIVDDVITAGTAIRESLSIISEAGARSSAILIGLNRQERGKGSSSAIEEIEHTTGVPVISIITLDDIMVYLKEQGDQVETLDKVQRYRQAYGI